ncbi:MAG: serine hydrolase, partial [Mycolicibacterium sp.]
MTVPGSRVARLCAAGSLLLTLATAPSCGQPGHPTDPPPPSTGTPTATATATATDPVADFADVSQLMHDAIAAHRLPGAVVQIGHAGKIVFRQAFGSRKLAGEPGLDGSPAPAEPMTEDTIFDLASLSKSLATAPAFLQLYERGLVRID